jgi:DNA-binding NarL/FixJ family response regulator
VSTTVRITDSARARGHSMTKPRLLLADDHTILIEGLKALLAPEFDVVATAEDGRAVLEAAELHRPDLILLDISMPGLNGIEAARRLSQTNPGAKIVILTMHADLSFVRASFEVGVAGYVLKQSAATELLTALHEVTRGRSYISPSIRERLGTDMPVFLMGAKKGTADLTPRQREVLQLLAEGHVRKEIAQTLGVCVKTVEFHKRQICERLGLRNVAELTAYAIRHGIAPSE